MGDDKKSPSALVWKLLFPPIVVTWVIIGWLTSALDDYHIFLLIPAAATAIFIVLVIAVESWAERGKPRPVVPAPPPPDPKKPVQFRVELPKDGSPSDTIGLFCSCLLVGNTDGGYRLFHNSLRALQDPEALRELVRRNSHMFDKVGSGTNLSSRTHLFARGGSGRMKYKVQGNNEVTARFRLERESDEWKITGYRIKDQWGNIEAGIAP